MAYARYSPSLVAFADLTEALDACRAWLETTSDFPGWRGEERLVESAAVRACGNGTPADGRP